MQLMIRIIGTRRSSCRSAALLTVAATTLMSFGCQDRGSVDAGHSVAQDEFSREDAEHTSEGRAASTSSHDATEIDMSSSPSSLIEPGMKAPEFYLKDQKGATHRLADYSGRTVVLYFYPKDDTPGCTAEACEFRDQLPEFEKLNTPVLGVSPDEVESHQKFVDKYDLNFPLLADPRRASDDVPPVCDKYGVWQERSMYGRTFMGVARTTYIIGPDGRVAHRFDNVKPTGHADEVLEWLRSSSDVSG